MTSPSLFLLTYGPVQPFIAAGRRTADLWAGSLMLANLAETALDTVAEAVGEEHILFPSLADPETLCGESKASAAPDPEDLGHASYPNRVLARLPADRDATDLANRIERALRNHLREATEAALQKVRLTAEMSEAEVAETLEAAARELRVYWAALPVEAAADLGLYTNAANDYGTRYRTIEGIVGSRKALREGASGSGVQSGYRCTLMPAHPALVPPGANGDTPRPRQVRTWWTDIAERAGGRLRAGEQLSAIALAKRFYPDFLRAQNEIEGGDASFPSTSSFATADYVTDILDTRDAGGPHAESIRDAIDALDRAASALRGMRPFEASLPNRPGPLPRISGRFLIGDDLDVDEALREMGRDPKTVQDGTLQQIEAHVRDLNEARAALRAAASAAGIAPPSRYYGVLVLDGDHMGAWFSGTIDDLLREKGLEDPFGDKDGEKRHQAISDALTTFARCRVPPIVERDHRGRLVYGGGDDVVALLSFRDALPAARAIREAFEQTLRGGTVSAGLVLAHHLTPLQQVLGATREAEQRAKRCGRDRLCITALKRSGAPVSAVLPWDHLAPLIAYRDLIAPRGQTAAGSVSSGLLYDLQDTARRLSERTDDGCLAIPDDLTPALRADAGRLFRRRAEQIPEDQRQQAFEDTVGAMMDHAADDLEKAGPDRHSRHPVEATLDRLAIAQFLGKGGDR